MIPCPAECQCLFSTSSIIIIIIVIISFSSSSPSSVSRDSTAYTRCFSLPDDYIDRVGGWVEARETVTRSVIYLSSGREEIEREGENTRTRKDEKYRDSRANIDIYRKDAHKYGYMCHRYRIAASPRNVWAGSPRTCLSSPTSDYRHI